MSLYLIWILFLRILLIFRFVPYYFVYETKNFFYLNPPEFPDIYQSRTFSRMQYRIPHCPWLSRIYNKPTSTNHTIFAHHQVVYQTKKRLSFPFCQTNRRTLQLYDGLYSSMSHRITLFQKS